MMATIIAGSLYANSAFAADMQNVSLQLISVLLKRIGQILIKVMTIPSMMQIK